MEQHDNQVQRPLPSPVPGPASGPALEPDELTEEDLEQVNGGTNYLPPRDATINKTKTVDKTYQQWSNYIRG